MDRETLKQLVREQRAGYELLHRLEVDEWRRATFADRVAGFAAIMAFSRQMKMHSQPDTGIIVSNRWRLIRKNYQHGNRRPDLSGYT